MRFGEFGSIESRATSSVPIRRRPFEAYSHEIHRSRTNGTQRSAWGRLYRDGRGRIRRELVIEASPPGGPSFTLVTVFDPDTLVTRIIDSQSGKPTEVDFAPHVLGRGAPLTSATEGAEVPTFADSAGVERGSPACPVPAPRGERGESSAPAVESLGEKLIEGMRCHGSRESDGEEIVEIWLSEELVTVIVFAKYETGELEAVYRVFDVHLGEPDPVLFDGDATSA